MVVTVAGAAFEGGADAVSFSVSSAGSSFQRAPFAGEMSAGPRPGWAAPPGRLDGPDPGRRVLRTITGGLGRGSADGMGFRSRVDPTMAEWSTGFPDRCAHGRLEAWPAGGLDTAPASSSIAETSRPWASAAGTGTSRPPRAGNGRRVRAGAGTGRSATARVATSFTWDF